MYRDLFDNRKFYVLISDQVYFTIEGVSNRYYWALTINNKLLVYSKRINHV